MRRQSVAYSFLLAGFVLAGSVSAQLQFAEVSSNAGVSFLHQVDLIPPDDQAIAAGVATGDFDRDGWIDLFATTVGESYLFRNRGDGSFVEVAERAGIIHDGRYSVGPAFADVDADGWLDLLINARHPGLLHLFHNQGDGSFADMTASSGLDAESNVFSAAFGDYDLDGDLDLALGRWLHNCPAPCTGHLWTNDGSGHFIDVDVVAGIHGYGPIDWTFTPNFADLDGDWLPELLVAADFETSRVYRNLGAGLYDEVTDPAVITDQHGMGAAIGDYDNDGDLDWFVTSIYDPPEGRTGNRLYRNDGAGTLEEVSEDAGVRDGYWGWGACFADFDNDGHLDIFHTNGFVNHGTWTRDWENDPSRLFINTGAGTFVERSADFGLVDTGQGRGVSCFDYDRDGDVDIFISNNRQKPALWRNDGTNLGGFLILRVADDGSAAGAAGARVRVKTGSTEQLRVLRMEGNFESQQPLEVHFGLGDARKINALQIEWPSGRVEVHRNLAANQHLGVAPGGLLCPMFIDLTAASISRESRYSACYRVAIGDQVLVSERGAVHLTSGHRVSLGSGFSVASGGTVRVVIDPSLRIP